MCRVLGLQGLAFVEEGLLFPIFFFGGVHLGLLPLMIQIRHYLQDPKPGDCGIFLTMGNAGFISGP